MEFNLTTFLNEQLNKMVKKDFITLDGEKNVSHAINLLRDRDERCVLIIHNNEVVGIVTRSDILFKVFAQKKDPQKVRLREIMSTPVIMLPATATVADALNVMDKHSIRQIFVGSSSAIVGMISKEGLFGEIHKISINLAEDAFSGAPVCIINPKATTFAKNTNLQCPYCQSIFTYKDELSRHIDRIHLGSGALEGDLRRIFE